MTMVGRLQGLVALGRFDISSAASTQSSFRAAPLKGHLDQVKRIFGHLVFLQNRAIPFWTEPDYSNLPDQDFDWSRLVYRNEKEQIPKDTPKPLKTFVVSTTYIDADLMHN